MVKPARAAGRARGNARVNRTSPEPSILLIKVLGFSFLGRFALAIFGARRIGAALLLDFGVKFGTTARWPTKHRHLHLSLNPLLALRLSQFELLF